MQFELSAVKIVSFVAFVKNVLAAFQAHPGFWAGVGLLLLSLVLLRAIRGLRPAKLTADQ
jgi:hypothetical protein